MIRSLFFRKFLQFCQYLSFLSQKKVLVFSILPFS